MVSDSPPRLADDGDRAERDIRQTALRLLARSELTVAELERRLAPLAGSRAMLDRVIGDLQAGGFLSDRRYAEQRSASLAKKFSDARVVRELRTKGVDGEIIGAALGALDDERDRARRIWRRKFADTPPADRKEWARQARFLQSRGFSVALIRDLLNTLGEVRADVDEDP